MHFKAIAEDPTARERGARPLETGTNLFDFFHAHVDEAARARGAVSQEGVYYLSNLLVERGRAPEAPGKDTLVELQLEALHASRPKAVMVWRELGDMALYVAGFFRGSLERRSVSPDYYEHMGAAAYGRLSSLLESPRGQVVGGGRGIDAIFAELSHHFALCTGILVEVRRALRAKVAETDDQALIVLYEEWLSTGDAEVARKLRRLGLQLPEGRSLDGA